jgi:hypothetical protein
MVVWEGTAVSGSQAPAVFLDRLAQPLAAGVVPDSGITPAIASLPRWGGEAMLIRTQLFKLSSFYMIHYILSSFI